MSGSGSWLRRSWPIARATHCAAVVEDVPVVRGSEQRVHGNRDRADLDRAPERAQELGRNRVEAAVALHPPSSPSSLDSNPETLPASGYSGY